nr:maco-A 19 [Mamestra configurata nucleopolyhedrovirus A]
MILLIFIIVVIIIIIVLFYTNSNKPVKVPDVVAEGPTCDTYYLNDTLVNCPAKHEFRETKCVPIDETGCTAALNPTKITANEMVCTNRSFIRMRRIPCQGIRNCVTSEATISREGYCFDLQSDGTYVEKECMQVPGCRHLDAIHIPENQNFDNALPVDKVPCPLPAGEPIQFYRNAHQPCLSGFQCINRNEIFESVCSNNVCINDQGRCADCALYDRCLYKLAYTPVTAIANP